MLRSSIALLGAALLAASTALYAQAPGGDAAKGERRHKMRAAHAEAAKACEGKTGAERGDCMRTQMCARAPDPAQCEARAKERRARRAQVREACKGKAGEELKACIREQRRSD